MRFLYTAERIESELEKIKKLLGAVIAAALLVPCLPVNIIHAEEERGVLVRLTDSISYNPRNFTSTQEGELYFTRYDASTSVSATNDLITVRHEKAAAWRSNFYVDGSSVRTDKKTVIDIRFKAELDDYSVSPKPKTSLRLYHNGGSFQIETSAFNPSEHDGFHTTRFVVNPDNKKVYVSLDGAAYKSASTANTSAETYGGQVRIYPTAVPSVYNQSTDDAVKALETPVTFTFDEFYIYQTSGEMPSETEDLTPRITEEQSQEFDALREKWKSYLTGGSGSSDLNVQEKISGINSSALYHWNRMNKNAGRTYLFSDITNTGASSHIRSNYNYLLIMARAYATPGGSLYHNSSLAADLINALDWMYENKYNENMSEYDNWWEWEIGVPEVLNNIIVLMYDELTSERITKYERAVNRFSPDPRFCIQPFNYSSTAANRLSMCFVVGMRGIIVKDPARVRLASDSLDIVFDYVTSGDGFYSDGSFIQHDRHPYNGGYGVGMVSDLSAMMYLLGGSSYEVNAADKGNIYDWIYKGYVPLMYHGIMMDAVTGRSGSRSYNSTYCAVTMLKTVLLLADAADAENSARLKSIAKTWISENTLGNLYTDYNTEISTIKMMNELMADSTVTGAEVQEGNFQYAGMDRVVHNRKNYSFAVSMFSDRIYNFESILNENLRGWHTADGMTYLYNSDTAQYTDAFWPTINANRLAGTTVAQRTFSNGEGAGSLSSESWAGGASVDGMYGSAGMSLKAYGSDLTAKKSWFMFDDEIVALGAGITGTDSAETIIENRKLNDGGNNVLTADGVSAAVNKGSEEELTDVKWMHLQGNTEGSDIGYYMFGGADVKAMRETRTGSWHDINSSDSADIYSRSYMNLWIDHGSSPSEETYAYALLPGKSAEETRQYSENPAVEIIRNDSAVQAVKNTALGITGANFWTDTSVTADKITSNKQAAVMVRDDGETLTLGISDPTQKNSGTVEITYDEAAGEVISCDDRITVLSSYPKLKLSVAVGGALGQTQSIKLYKQSEKEYISPYVLIDNNISLENSGAEYTVSEQGSVKYRAWTSQPTASVTADGGTFSVTQKTKAMYKDHFLLSSHQAIPHDSPTLINISYKVNAAEENTTERAEMSLYIPGITSWKAGTGTIELKNSMNEYRTLMILISPSDKKIYYSNDGKTFSETAFEGELTSDITEARLYTIAKPDSSYSTEDDGKTQLESPVTWTFDKIEISPYIDDGRSVLFSSFNSATCAEGIEYTASVVNVSAYPQNAAIIAAAYDGDGKMAGISINSTGDILYNEKVIKTGIIAAENTGKLTVKAFIWDSINGMKPYDKAE